GEYALEVGELMNVGNQLINIETIKALKIIPGNHILEIGMGNGCFVEQILKDSTIKYTGIDHSEEMVNQACKRNQNFIQSKQAFFLKGNAESLPFTDNTFDNVFTVNTLYFWEHPHAILNEIHRVLKPEGQLVMAIRPKYIMEEYPFVKYNFTMYNKEDISELFANHPFRINAIWEKQEPEQDILGQMLPVCGLYVSVEKTITGL
ncbi:MAG: class I SAM-dependent methyltransferase, partial [Bacteroidales bacterium]|nr:class I SAM-dependent methyltransferase [Bacteroidales bacterium]